MKVLAKLKLNTEVEIDLTDFGFDESKRWDDLKEDEQNEILDPIRNEQIATVTVEEIDED